MRGSGFRVRGSGFRGAQFEAYSLGGEFSRGSRKVGVWVSKPQNLASYT